MNSSSNSKSTANAKTSINVQHGTKTQVNIPRQNVRHPTNKTRQNVIRTGGPSLQNPLQQLTGSLPIINAPTSLTNLAQLGGISLPVNSLNLNLNQSGQRLQSFSTNLPPSVTLHPTPSNFIITPTTIRAQRPPGCQITTQPTNNPCNSPSFDLVEMPSIYSFNQSQTSPNTIPWKSAMSEFNKQEPRDLLRNFKSTSTAANSPPNKSRNARPQVFDDSAFRPDDTLNLPPSESLSIFSNSSRPQKVHQGIDNNEVRLPSLESFVDSQCVDINGDQNNISLIKLMAILNNPALTITAVSNRDPPRPAANFSMDFDKPFPATTNQPDRQQLNPSFLGLLGRTRQSDTEQHSQQQTDSITNRTRVPQSAANIQVIHSHCLSSIPRKTRQNDSFDQASSNTAGASSDPSNARPTISLAKKQPEHQINRSSNHSGTLPSTANDLSRASPWSSIPGNSRNEGSSRPPNKLNDPTMLSTSVRNLMMQQVPSGVKGSNVSAQLLKHIANQAKDNNWSGNQSQQPSILEPECILTAPRHILSLCDGAKRKECMKNVTTLSSQPKASQPPLKTSKYRLYVPRSQSDDSVSKREPLVQGSRFNLISINVEAGEERELYVSDRHFMLNSMMPNKTGEKSRPALSEPDEIFVNRSKRVMSKIDSMIERKKRRRFERISGRLASKVDNPADNSAESEDEWSSDDDADGEHFGIIEAQLPLEEIETEEKRNHLLSVGLVSRVERSKIKISQCEKKLELFSPLAFKHGSEIPQIFSRFVNTMLTTDGIDIQLKIDSNIKRNDLPLIEGLNRNSSRLKMNYMGILGLEKRSRRTTLYKVKPAENVGITAHKHNDLNKIKNPVQATQKLGLDPPGISSESLKGKGTVPNRTNPFSCRGALKNPNKHEYMKSLGLIAS